MGRSGVLQDYMSWSSGSSYPSGNCYFNLYWEEISKDLANRTTTLRLRFTVKPTADVYMTFNPGVYIGVETEHAYGSLAGIDIDDITFSILTDGKTYNASANTETQLWTGTYVLKHVSGFWNDNITADPEYGRYEMYSHIGPQGFLLSFGHGHSMYLKSSGTRVSYYSPTNNISCPYMCCDVEPLMSTNRVNILTRSGSCEINFNWAVLKTNAVTNTSTVEWYFSFKDLYGKNGGGTLYDEAFYVNGVLQNTKEGRWSSSLYEVNHRCNNLGEFTYLGGVTDIVHDGTGDQLVTVGLNALQIQDIYYANATTNPEHYTATIAGMREKTITLPYIVRSAFIESILDGLTTCTDEDPLNILYTNPMGSSATSLQAGISVSNGAAMEVPYRDISKTSTVYTFNLTTSEWAAIFAKTLDNKSGGVSAPITSCPIRFYLKSTVPAGTGSETRVSTREGTMTFINYKPVMNNPVLKDVNPITTNLTGNPDIFVRYASDIQFDLKGTARKQAKLTNYYIANGDQTINALTGTMSGITGDENKAEFFMQIFDNRGYFDAVQRTYSVNQGNYIPYVPLTCAVKNGLLDANGNLVVTISGKYFAGSFGAVKNTLSLRYNIRKNGEADSWQYLTATNIQPDSNNNYTYSFTIKNLDYTDRYLLTVCATDQINQEGSTTETIIGAVPVFDWGKNDFAFYVPVTINGASVPSVVEQDKSGIWTYRKWTDGTAECWGKVSFNSTVTTALGSLYTSGAKSEANVSFPSELFIDIPVITATLDSKNAACWLMASSNTAAGDKTSATSTGRYEIVRATSLSNGAFTINYHVRGKWQ